jgi:hypothetical protein
MNNDHQQHCLNEAQAQRIINRTGSLLNHFYIQPNMNLLTKQRMQLSNTTLVLTDNDVATLTKHDINVTIQENNDNQQQENKNTTTDKQ